MIAFTYTHRCIEERFSETALEECSSRLVLSHASTEKDKMLLHEYIQETNE